MLWLTQSCRGETLAARPSVMFVVKSIFGQVVAAEIDPVLVSSLLIHSPHEQKVHLATPSAWSVSEVVLSCLVPQS